MMAETVKKSRIVSDDDLEESLMQEFNMRLKTCLSSEGLNDEDDEEEEEEEEKKDESTKNDSNHHLYENIQVIVKSNGNAHVNDNERRDMLDLQPQHQQQQHQSVTQLSHNNKLDSVEEFIQIERECLSMEGNNGLIEHPSVNENEEEPESEAEHKPLQDAAGQISAKDRMLLSTDSASCLLFTQTVTSPMLTPSDERVDFMKGFQESEETTPPTTESDEQAGNQEVETFEQIEQEIGERVENEIEHEQEQDLDPTEPEVDQHDAELDQPEVDQLMDDNLSVEHISPREVDPVPEFLDEPEVDQVDRIELEIRSPDLLRDVPTIEVTSSMVTNKFPETSFEIVETVEVVPRMADEERTKRPTSLTGRPMSTTPTDLDCKLPSVKSLKDQYIKTANTNSEATTPTSPKFEKAEMSQMKSLDIMKQISKFEQISPTREEPSTEVTETSSYVETTVVETVNGEAHVQQQQVQKKKTKKKSRSHANEKENISVCDLDSRFYNVNVKSLCRSFGDLTKLPEENRPEETNNKSRAKSMNDIRQVGLSLNGRHIENVFNGVNVKALKQRFCSTQSMNNLNSCSTTSTPKRIQTYDHSHRQKSSFSKFDALQKKNVLHVRSSDSSKAQEKFNGNQTDATNCKSCGKIVFQMEQMKAERSIWHKNCFRCTECNKQLTVDTYQSHEGTLYCKPHFKALFAPKAVEEEAPQKPRKHELIIRENQPKELPPDVVRASDKPDLGLEELQSLNVKERFQVFEQHVEEDHQYGIERTSSAVNVKRSPSILSKLARFQAKGMDIGVADDSLNGIPIEESSTEEEQEEEEEEDEDADLVRAKRAQREKPFHFTGMSDVKNKWEHGEQNGRDERREERKQEIQNIRNRLFMGKQGKMKEMYQQAVMESESGANVKRNESIEVTDTRSIKERFEKGEVDAIKSRGANEEEEVFESEISKNSRSIFKELDANATKAPPLIPAQKSASKIFNRQMSNVSNGESEVVKCTQHMEDVTVETKDIQQRFKFFEAYQEPDRERKRFRITPPRDGQVKVGSPDRELYRDPEVIRGEEHAEDSGVAVKTQTAKKMLNKFRQMEEDLSKDQVPMGPKPLKRFTPPPEPIRSESESDEDASESMEEESDNEQQENGRGNNATDCDLLEAQKAARAKQLRAKFEKWEANEIKREQNNSSVNIIEEFGEEQSQIESTKSLRARFESMKGGQNDEPKVPRAKVNRFVNNTITLESCQDCKKRVYPLEKIAVHGAVYHKKCFKCMECNTILRMDSYSYNQGLLYCTPHFKRLFITKGNYDTAFGLEQHKEKWNSQLA